MVKVEDQKREAEVVLVTSDSEAITIVVDLVDEDFSDSVKLNKRKFNEKTKEREADQEVFNNLLDALHERLGVSAENSIDLKDQGEVDLSAAEEELDSFGEDGTMIEVYFDPNSDRKLSLFPIRTFPRFDNNQITSKIAKKLEKAYKKEKELKGLPISDHELKHQFLIPFKVYVDGEERHYFLSSVENDNEESVKTKYRNTQIDVIEDQIDTMRDRLEEVSDDKKDKLEAKIEKSQKSLDQIIERARQSKIDEFKDVLGIDIEEMLENEEVVDVILTSVNKTSLENRQLKGEVYYYMTAQIVSEPHEEEDIDEELDEIDNL